MKYACVAGEVYTLGGVRSQSSLLRARAAVAELNAAGMSVDSIVDRFRHMNDFNEDRTRYYVDHALRRSYRPYRCKTIQELGGCLGSVCPIYKGSMTSEPLQKAHPG